jgi:CRP/FNR family transcriptional regulator
VINDDDLSVLARVPWLAPLGKEALSSLAGASRRLSLSKGGLLWRRGDRADSVAVILSGRLDVARNTADGRPMLFRSLGPGSSVGLSTLAGSRHSADVVTSTACQFLLIPGHALRGAVRANPPAVLAALAQLGETISQLSDEMEELRFLDLDERLRRLIRRRAAGLRELSVTHENLAQQVGATRANVSRALKRMERRGAIRCRRGRIELLAL